jgi:hypothetical protein
MMIWKGFERDGDNAGGTEENNEGYQPLWPGSG